MSWTDKDGNSYANTAWNFGDSTTATKLNRITANQMLMMTAGMPLLVGEVASQITASADGGALFHAYQWFGDQSARAEEKTRTLIDASDYQDILSDEITTDPGPLKHRMILIEFWRDTQAALSDMTYRLPGQTAASGNEDPDASCDEEVYGSGDGAVPFKIGFFSGAGGQGGNYDCVWTAGDHELNFYVNDDGNLKCEYTYSGGGEYFLVLSAKIWVGPKMIAS